MVVGSGTATPASAAVIPAAATAAAARIIGVTISAVAAEA
jgi:hypothetical protein